MDGALYESIILPFVLFVISSALSSAMNVLSITSGLLDTGTNTLRSSAERLSNSAIDKFDGKSVAGSYVRAAIDEFGVGGMAVLIHNKGMEDGKYLNYAYLLDGAAVDSAYKFGSTEPYSISASVGSTGYTGGVFKPEGEPYYTGSRKVETDGTQAKSFEKRALAQKTSSQYVSPTASYFAWLIKDNRGEIIGAIFTEE